MVIIGWAIVAIIVGVIAQRGFGRIGLPWGLVTFAIANVLAMGINGTPPADLPEYAYNVGAFIMTAGVAVALVMAALFTMPKRRQV